MVDNDIFVNEMQWAIENTPREFPESVNVACQGTEGSNSQEAVKKLFRAPNIMYFSSFEAVFNAIEMGLCKYGVIPLENTAFAAREVAMSDRNDMAAIASKACIKLYDLNCILSGIQNNDNNYTRFICISKKLEIYPGANRTSLMVILPHEPGSLYRFLSPLNDKGINLLKLESRPLPGREFEFMFYFDIETSVYSSRLSELLDMLPMECEEFRYLGSYSEII